MATKVIVFGKDNSGKTALIQRVEKKDFDHNYRPTIGMEFSSIPSPSGQPIHIWNHAGAARYKSLLPIYAKDAHLGIYCVSLETIANRQSTETIDRKQIEGDINEIRKSANNLPIFIVGTKADLCKDDDDFIKLKELNIPNTVVLKPTSAKLNENIAEIAPLLFNLPSQTTKQPLSLYNIAKGQLLVTMHTNQLSEQKSSAIKHELKELELAIANPNKDKALAIQQFTNNCERILKDDPELSNIMKVVLTVAAVVVVTLIAAIIGFGIGFSAGIWTGPGAFISGILAGEFAAVETILFASTGGLASGGILAFGLFSPPEELDLIHEVADAATKDFAIKA